MQWKSAYRNFQNLILDRYEKNSIIFLMPTLEDLEHRVARLEALFEGVIKERLNSISQRLDQLYEKTERDKTEILTKTERDKTEILAKLYERAEGLKTEIFTKMETDKREILRWIIGLLLGFGTLIITSMWALLSFAIKP